MDNPNYELDEILVGIFVQELNSQMKLADIAASNINHFLSSRMGDNEVFWYHMENLLKALVAMANILWTSNNRNPYKQRSRLLRDRFNLSDEKLPDNLRQTRNWFEHFDEKIDDWWSESRTHSFADRNIMPLTMIQGLDISDYARFFDPTTSELSVFGRSVNTAEMFDYLKSIMNRINDAFWLWPTGSLRAT